MLAFKCYSINHAKQQILRQISGCKCGALQVLIATSNADYLCAKPAPGYKKVFAHTAEQADILHEARVSVTLSGTNALSLCPYVLMSICNSH